MEIIIGLLVLLVIIFLIGRNMSPPDPKTLPLDKIYSRLTSESKWINKYEMLPDEYKSRKNIVAQYKAKKLYILELHLARLRSEYLMYMTGKDISSNIVKMESEKQSLQINKLSKTIDLIKSGYSEQEVSEIVQSENIT